MELRVEPATDADVEAMVEVQIASFESDALLYPGVEVGGPPGYNSAEHLRACLGERACYKLLLDGALVGVMIVIDEGDGHVHLDVIAIHPDQQGRGVGTAAMAFLERAHPAERYTLDTPSYALRNHHFYEKLGYVKVGESAHLDVVLFAYEKR